MSLKWPLPSALAPCALAAANAVPDDEGSAVRILNHVLLEAVVLLLIAVVALCALLVLLGRMLSVFRAGRPSLLESLLMDTERGAQSQSHRLNVQHDTSQSSSAHTSRRLHASFWPQPSAEGLEVPTRIPIMRRILEARGRLHRKTPEPASQRAARQEAAARGSPKLLGRERLQRSSGPTDSKSSRAQHDAEPSSSPPAAKPRGSEVRKSSARASTARQVAAPAGKKEAVAFAALGPVLYHKLFSQAAETEDLREVVYCSLAQPSTSLFSSPAASPRDRAASDDVRDATPRSSIRSTDTASTTIHDNAMSSQPSQQALQRGSTQRMAWQESWLSQATRKKLPVAAETVKLAWSDYAARHESAGSCAE